MRPPKMNAEIGTPCGSSHLGSIVGHCDAGAVNRAFGCAAFSFDSGVQSRPCQSMQCFGGASVMPSHQTSPSSVSATFVKMQFFVSVAIAFGFVDGPVPGATPKKPASGLIANSFPSLPGLIHAMSSPTVKIFQPSKPFGGTSMAKFVLPHADGNAAATYVRSPFGDS